MEEFPLCVKLTAQEFNSLEPLKLENHLIGFSTHFGIEQHLARTGQCVKNDIANHSMELTKGTLYLSRSEKALHVDQALLDRFNFMLPGIQNYLNDDKPTKLFVVELKMDSNSFWFTQPMYKKIIDSINLKLDFMHATRPNGSIYFKVNGEVVLTEREEFAIKNECNIALTDGCFQTTSHGLIDLYWNNQIFKLRAKYDDTFGCGDSSNNFADSYCNCRIQYIALPNGESRLEQIPHNTKEGLVHLDNHNNDAVELMRRSNVKIYNDVQFRKISFIF